MTQMNLLSKSQASFFKMAVCFSVLLTATLAVSLVLTMGSTARAADLMKDFDSIGGNDALLDRAKALNPEERVRVVQDRIVTRRNRVEIAPEYSNVVAGDSFNSTNNFGVNVHYHINPHWSVGVKYDYSFNDLKAAGQEVINNTNTNGKGWIPDIDYPKQEVIGLLNWYPIYGKMNLYELGVVHFDIYTVGGVGRIFLNSGATMSYTAGGGIGLWLSQHLTTRFEMRYETYQATEFNGKKQMDTTVAGLQVGYLL